jgi:hypothetical protein
MLLTGAFGQTSQIPYAPDNGPLFSNDQISHLYPGSFSSIRRVNFRNFRYLSFDEAGNPTEDFSLRNGHYQHDEPLDRQSIDLDSIRYLGGSSSALILLSYFAAAGSSSQGGMAKVFTVSDGHLRIVQAIVWDTHFQAGQPTESFDPDANTLVIRSAHYIPGDAHCCVSAMDVVRFRWDGTHFVQTGLQTEHSEYGKKEGKTLPR